MVFFFFFLVPSFFIYNLVFIEEQNKRDSDLIFLVCFSFFLFLVCVHFFFLSRKEFQTFVVGFLLVDV